MPKTSAPINLQATVDQLKGLDPPLLSSFLRKRPPVTFLSSTEPENTYASHVYSTTRLKGSLTVYAAFNSEFIMAASRFQAELYMSEQFVESAGTILFRLSTREICILHLLRGDEYILPKGRRNLHESHKTTAIRETIEETGIPCKLLSIDMHSRVCPMIETEHVPDEARLYGGVCEPIALQQRHIGEGEIKLIWWFVASVNEEMPVGPHEKDNFEVKFHNYEEVLEKLTFKDDREIVKKAIDLVNKTT